MNAYSVSEVGSAYVSIQGKRFEGRIFASKAEDDSSSPSVSKAVLRPDLYVDVCGVFCPNRAVPFISMMVFLCSFKLYVGQTALLGVAGQWCLVGGDIRLRVLGLCERN